MSPSIYFLSLLHSKRCAHNLNDEFSNMPSGKSVSLEFRMLVFKNHVQHGHSAEWIMKHCFAPDLNNMQNITLKYLKSLCNKLSSSPEFAQDYLLGAIAYRKFGRPLKFAS